MSYRTINVGKHLILCLLIAVGLTACGGETSSNVPSFSLGELEVRQDESGNGYLKDGLTENEIVAVFRYDETGELCTVDLETFAEEENVCLGSGSPDGEGAAPGKGTAGYSYEETGYIFAVGEWEKITADCVDVSSFYPIPTGSPIREEFGGAEGLSEKLREKIRTGASFSWNESLDWGEEKEFTFDVPGPGTYYIAARANYDKTVGTLLNKDGEPVCQVWGLSPMATAKGTADITYAVMRRGK